LGGGIVLGGGFLQPLHRCGLILGQVLAAASSLPGMSMRIRLPSRFQSESADVDGGDANIHRLLFVGLRALGGAARGDTRFISQSPAVIYDVIA
jgi:hypothetical protein